MKYISVLVYNYTTFYNTYKTLNMDINMIEQKVQKIWDELEMSKTDITKWIKIPKSKKYVLDMFPYPSASGLHVWHWRWYVLSDVVAKIFKMEWNEVFHPMGFDSLGLPAENYAVKVWVHPKKTTFDAIHNYIRQLGKMGSWYDWDYTLATCTPDYYKWNQWIFLKFYEKGFAYKRKAPVNYCPSCETVLANEQVVEGKCERCKSEVIKKEISQWFFKITDFAQDLLDDLEKLDWPDRVKLMQKNWIWRSSGSQFQMSLYQDNDNKLTDYEVFTTRLDTVFGMTYVVFSPEKVMEMINEWMLKISNQKEVEKYCKESINKSEIERWAETKQKSWVKLEGIYSINPFNWQKVEVWAADYVIWWYWTWVVMAVPAHDTRDWLFAKQYDLPIIVVIKPQQKIKFAIKVADIKDMKQAQQEADNNELFYNIDWDTLYGWIAPEDENFMIYWINKFANWKKIEDEKMLSKDELFDFQQNTAFTKKWIVCID